MHLPSQNLPLVTIFAIGVSETVLRELSQWLDSRFMFVLVTNEAQLREQLGSATVPIVLCGDRTDGVSGEALIRQLPTWHKHAQGILLIEADCIASTLGTPDALHHFRYISLPLDVFAARQVMEAAAAVAVLRHENQTLIHEMEQYLAMLRRVSENRVKQIVKERDNYRQQNKRLLDSIRNAERIQRAILPSEAKLDALLSQYFLIYKPRDIVSGDFYWMHIVKDEERTVFYIAVADCTGHGVPGAFLSMVGTTLLNQIVAQNPHQLPGAILEQLHDGVLHSLCQTSNRLDIDDGVEICLCRLDGLKVTFAGARRPLYVASQPQNHQWHFEEIKGDRRAIGGGRRREGWQYTNHELELPRGAMLYLTTDGFADQSDPQSVRYGARRLRDKLLEVAPMTCVGQRFALQKELSQFQQEEPQRDDMTIFGVRLPIVSATTLQLPSGTFSVTGNLIL
ncbi:MAG: PP2C family protein-serine/threonine phosphatase [Acidobacteriota bacterium]